MTGTSVLSRQHRFEISCKDKVENRIEGHHHQTRVQRIIALGTVGPGHAHLGVLVVRKDIGAEAERGDAQEARSDLAPEVLVCLFILLVARGERNGAIEASERRIRQFVRKEQLI